MQVGIVAQCRRHGLEHLLRWRPGGHALSEGEGSWGGRDQLGHHGDDRCLDLIEALSGRH